MDVTSRALDDVTVIAATGRFDFHTAPDVAVRLEKAAAAEPARVIVDMAGVEFVDSTGLATLVQGMKRCREHGGDLKLCCLEGPARIIFELTRLDAAFDVHPTAEAAAAAFRPAD